MINIKDIVTLKALAGHPLHPDMEQLIAWIYHEQKAIVITCAYEERAYPSVHSTTPLRGIDIRSSIYKDPLAVVRRINENWIYNPDAPEKVCALYHDTGRGPHIHLQVHDNTLRR